MDKKNRTENKNILKIENDKTKRNPREERKKPLNILII